MNWHLIWNIALKDWKEIRYNRLAWTPALVLPLIFVVVIPLLIIYLPSLGNIPGGNLNNPSDVEALLKVMPAAVQDQLAGLDMTQSMVLLVLGYFFAPMFLMVPLLVASVFGADSIVGEKERKTLEALLYTPATDRELYIAKLISSVAPAIAIAWASFALALIINNVAGAHLMGGIWFPPSHWWPLIFWVTPAVATLGMSIVVLVSSRVSTFIGAQQVSGLVAMPIVLLVLGQVLGIIYLGVLQTFVLGVVIWLINVPLIWIGVKQFSRSALMARI